MATPSSMTHKESSAHYFPNVDSIAELGKLFDTIGKTPAVKKEIDSRITDLINTPNFSFIQDDLKKIQKQIKALGDKISPADVQFCKKELQKLTVKTEMAVLQARFFQLAKDAEGLISPEQLTRLHSAMEKTGKDVRDHCILGKNPMTEKMPPRSLGLVSEYLTPKERSQLTSTSCDIHTTLTTGTEKQMDLRKLAKDLGISEEELKLFGTEKAVKNEIFSLIEFCKHLPKGNEFIKDLLSDKKLSDIGKVEKIKTWISNEKNQSVKEIRMLYPRTPGPVEGERLERFVAFCNNLPDPKVREQFQKFLSDDRFLKLSVDKEKASYLNNILSKAYGDDFLNTAPPAVRFGLREILFPSVKLPSKMELQGLRSLILANLNLKEIPSWVFDCKDLKQLTLIGNSFTALPPSIGKLKKLNALLVENTPLKELPEELVKCKKFKSLLLSRTELNVIPTQLLLKLAEKTEFDNLNLNECGIKEFPPELVELVKLMAESDDGSFCLTSNHLTKLPDDKKLLLELLNAIDICDSADLIGNPWDESFLTKVKETHSKLLHTFVGKPEKESLEDIIYQETQGKIVEQEEFSDMMEELRGAMESNPPEEVDSDED